MSLFFRNFACPIVRIYMIIGVTGGIGSGKSTVLRVVARKGYAVYDCDKEAKRIIMEDAKVRHQLIELFGEGVYADGVYQTGLVAAQVFADPQKLQQLNAIVHPAVMEDILSRKSDTLFVESAILVSSGLAKLCDAVVLITAPEQERIERILMRAAKRGQHMNVAQVRARIHAQIIEEESLRDAPYDLKLVNDDATPISQIVEQLIRFVEQ